MSALKKFVQAGLLIADAGADISQAAGKGLVGPLRVGQQRPGQHDHVAHTVSERALGQIGVAQLPHCHDRHGQSGV